MHVTNTYASLFLVIYCLLYIKEVLIPRAIGRFCSSQGQHLLLFVLLLTVSYFQHYDFFFNSNVFSVLKLSLNSFFIIHAVIYRELSIICDLSSNVNV